MLFAFLPVSLLNNIPLCWLSLFCLAMGAAGMAQGVHIRRLEVYAGVRKGVPALWLLAGAGAVFLGSYGVERMLLTGAGNGESWVAVLAGTFLFFLLTGRLVLGLEEWMECMTAAEVAGKLYGPGVRRLVAVSGICCSVGLATLHMLVIARVWSLFTGQPEAYTLVGVVAVVALYAVPAGGRGGLWLGLGGMVALVCWLWWQAFVMWAEWEEGPQKLVSWYQEGELQLSRLAPGFWWQLCFCMLPWLSPAQMQQLLATRDLWKSREIAMKAAGLMPLVQLLVAVLGWLVCLRYGGAAADIWKLLFSLPAEGTPLVYLTAAGGVLVVSLLGMSAAVGHLHAGGLLIGNDLFSGLGEQERFWLSRGAVVLLATLSWLAAVSWGGRSLGELMMWSQVCYIGWAPLLLRLTGFETGTRPAMVAGGVVAAGLVGGGWYGASPVQLFAAGLVGYVCLQMLSHLLLGEKAGGWVGIQAEVAMVLQQERAYFWRKWWTRQKHFSWASYLARQVPDQPATLVLMGGHVLLTLFLGYCWLPATGVEISSGYYYTGGFVLLFVSLALLLSPAWQGRVGRRMTGMLWYTLLLGGLLGLAAWMMLETAFNPLYTTLWLVNLCIAVWWLDGFLFISFLVTSLSASVWIFLQGGGRLQELPFSGGEAAMSLLFLAALGMAVVFKQRGRLLAAELGCAQLQQREVALLEAWERKRAREDLLAASLDQHVVNSMGELSSRLSSLLGDLSELPAKQRKQLGSYVPRLTSLARYILNLFVQAESPIRLFPAVYSIESLLDEAISLFHSSLGGAPPSRCVRHVCTLHEEWECDREQVVRLLTDSFLLLHAHMGHAFPIHIWVEEAFLTYPPDFSRQAQQEVKALRLIVTAKRHPVGGQEAFLVGQDLVAAPSPVGLSAEEARLLARHREIVAAHKGHMEVVEEGCTRLYVLPLYLAEVLPGMLSPRVYMTDMVSITPYADEERFLECVRRAKHISVKMVVDAFCLVKTLRVGEFRRSTEPFYLHAVGVAYLIAKWKGSNELVVAALLHDLIVDRKCGYEEVAVLFGKKVAELVENFAKFVTALREMRYKRVSMEKQLAYCMAQSEEVLHLRLADRLHNLRTAHALPPHRRYFKAEESEVLYAPIARKLGMGGVYREIVSLAKRLKQSSTQPWLR